MAAQKSSKGPKVSAPANKDLLARINYLHQASLLLAKSAPTLAQVYVQDLKSVARKSQLAVDKSIKRQLCKRCHTILIAGVTSAHTMVNKSRRQRTDCNVLTISCNACGVIKRFPVD